jgi:perosamine synthetase
MKATRNNLFCGLPGIGLGDIVGPKKTAEGLTSWFWDVPLYFTHKGRIAIRKACELMSIKPGDEVLMPAYNCGSEVDPVIKSGATVILYRVDRSSMTDVDDLQLRITKKTKAIYVTHYFGFPQPIARIREICEAHSIYLIEDCALSLFSSNGSAKLGTIGDIAVFSLTKALPVPDGGVLVANNAALIKEPWLLRRPSQLAILMAMIPLLKSHVMKRWSSDVITYPLYVLMLLMLRAKSASVQQRRNLHAGTGPEMLPGMYYNERMSNRRLSFITKRILLSCDAELIISKRRQNFTSMLSLFKPYDFIEPLFKELPPGVCPLYFPVLVDNRDELASKLYELGIDARAWWKGYHRGLPWKNFPEACSLKNRLLALPVHQDLSLDDIAYVVDNLISLSS